MDLPKAFRSWEYSNALSNAPCAVPRPNAPIVILPPVSVFKNCLNPLEGFPKTADVGICISLKNTEREAFGKPIHKFQGVSFKLSDMATQIEAARHLVYYAAWKKDRGLPVIKEAAMAKLFSSETAMMVTTEAIQVLGGYGYIKEYDVERFFRDAKILEIGEGTSEIQRMIIARELINSVQSV